MYFPQRIVS